VDWSSWYLTDEEDEGQTIEQAEIIRTMLSVLKEWARERGWNRLYIGGDQFFAWVPSEPLVRVSPDVYLIDDPPPLPDRWQTWLPGHRPPRFAVEVVSRGRKDDYEDAPLKYALLGAQELVIFDPGVTPGSESSQRIFLRLYRRNGAGAFLRVYAGPGPVHSVQLDAHLVVWRGDGVARLRLARDAAGRDLIPTVEEARLEAEQRTLEAEQRTLEAEQRALEEVKARHKAEQRALEEAMARHKAEQRLRELEEMLKKLRGPLG
jgi:Uma2 family endonuclease